jgi:hypothetical protein
MKWIKKRGDGNNFLGYNLNSTLASTLSLSFAELSTT